MRSILRERSRAADARTRAPRYGGVAVWLAASIVVHALVLLVFPDELARHAPRVEILHVQIDHQEVPPAREKPPRVRELAERERIAPNPPPGREPAPLSAPAPKAQPRADETRVPRSPPQPQRVEPPAQPAAQPIDEPIPTLVGPAIAEPQVRNAPEMNAPSAPAPAQPSATAPQGGADAAPAPRIADARPLSAPVRYRRTAEQGRVTLKVLVSREGRVAKATLEKTSGYPNLDRHALEAVTRWRFEPARKGDETVEQWLVVNVDY